MEIKIHAFAFGQLRLGLDHFLERAVATIRWQKKNPVPLAFERSGSEENAPQTQVDLADPLRAPRCDAPRQ